MKKINSLIFGILLLSGVSFAENLSLSDLAGKLPPLKQGLAWDIEDGKLNYLSTIEVLNWKGINLEVGYAGDAENTGHKAVAVISYQVLKLKDLGITLPILDLIEFNVGGYVGYGRIHLGEGLGEGNNELSYGPAVTIINVKF